MSFGGHSGTWNSNLMSAIDSALEKFMKMHITCTKVRFGKEVKFSGPYGSLEVIKRSFGDSKFKSDERNQLGVQKNLWKDILHAPKWDLVRKLCFQVLMGHLRSFRGHLEVIFMGGWSSAILGLVSIVLLSRIFGLALFWIWRTFWNWRTNFDIYSFLTLAYWGNIELMRKCLFCWKS